MCWNKTKWVGSKDVGIFLDYFFLRNAINDWSIVLGMYFYPTLLVEKLFNWSPALNKLKQYSFIKVSYLKIIYNLF